MIHADTKKVYHSQRDNHPKLGSKIKVAPIRTKVAIANIKKILADRPLYACLFTLGINTAYRANELLSIRVKQVRGLQPGDILELKQSKTDKYRLVALNKTAIAAVNGLLQVRTYTDEDYLFTGQRGTVLTVSSVSRLVKGWCESVGLKENYGSHTLRKTWGYWQYERGTSLPLLMEAFGHSSQQQTLQYLCVPSKDVRQIFEMEL